MIVLSAAERHKEFLRLAAPLAPCTIIAVSSLKTFSFKAQNERAFTAVPVATCEQYKRALLAIRDKNLPPMHFAMLRAQCRATDGIITATQLAEVAKYKNYNAANLQYGTLAFHVAQHLGFTPATRRDGTPRWWTTLSYSIDGAAEPETGHFQFIMRPELVAALQEMKWA